MFGLADSPPPLLPVRFEQRAIKAAATTTDFLYDRKGHLIAEANDATGAMIREYIWMDDLPVAMVDDTGSSPVVYDIHSDHLGRPQKLTAQDASVVWDGAWDPFGNPASISGSATMLLTFPGQYWDSETQLSQNWHRDYDPTIGRYVESDPIGLWGGIDTYAYVADNPVNRYDRHGLCDNVLHTCTLDNEQKLGGGMDGYSACNYNCSDGQERSFIAQTGSCPRFLSATDRRFNRQPWPRMSTGQAIGAVAAGTAVWGFLQALEYAGALALAL